MSTTRKQIIRNLKLKQAKWMTEREVARDIQTEKQDLSQHQYSDKKKREHPLRSTSPPKGDCYLQREQQQQMHQQQPYNNDPIAHQDHDTLIHHLTETITNRLRDELLQNTNRGTVPIRHVKESSSHQNQHLSSNIKEHSLPELPNTHCCQICCDLMLPPHKSPTILYPCGHTFCKSCTDAQRQKQQHDSSNGTAINSTKCPYCREDVVSIMENKSLKELIENFTSQKSQNHWEKESLILLKKQQEYHEAAIEKERSRKKYLAAYQNSTVRHRILMNQAEDMQSNASRCEERRRGIRLTVTTLRREKEHVESQMAVLQKELDLINTHLEEQAGKESELDRDVERLEEEMAVVRATIGQLETEMETKRALICACGADFESC